MNVHKGTSKKEQNLIKRGSTSQKKILVVEDHPDSREVLLFQLRHMGYEATGGATGEEGIEKALAESPDLIIMDLGLPGINGIEATVRLKQNPQTAHIPVVALTAWGDQLHKDKASQAGIAEYLTKPTHIEVIKDVIERSLQSKS